MKTSKILANTHSKNNKSTKNQQNSTKICCFKNLVSCFNSNSVDIEKNQLKQESSQSKEPTKTISNIDEKSSSMSNEKVKAAVPKDPFASESSLKTEIGNKSNQFISES